MNIIKCSTILKVQSIVTFQIPSRDSVRERLARLLNCSSRCRLLLCCCASTGAASSLPYIQMGRSGEAEAGSERLLRLLYVHVTCLPSPVSVCWWFFCLSSYIFLKEAITNSFSSWSLLGRARWDTQMQTLNICLRLFKCRQMSQVWKTIRQCCPVLWLEHSYITWDDKIVLQFQA